MNRREVGDCRHPKRGALTVDAADGRAYLIGKDSDGHNRGSVKLEYCESCGCVMVPTYLITGGGE